MKEAAISKSHLLPIIATFWFFVVLESILIWNSYGQLLRIMSFLGMVFATFLVSGTNGGEFKRRAYFFFFFAVAFTAWLTYAMSSTLTNIMSYMVKFIPLLLVTFWPIHILHNTYRLIRFVVIFFAIGGAIVSILSLTGYISYIPHYVLPPQETLHIRLGFDYYVYGIIPTLHDPFLAQTQRTCGMMKEPGHFAIILGFIYLIDRFRGVRINLWIILAGILTFSSNFFLMVVIAELRYLFTRKVLKQIFKYSMYGFLLFGAYFLLPSDIRERAYFLFYERNLADVIEALNSSSSSSSLTGGLDERADENSLYIYENLSSGEFLAGGAEYDSAYALSDYRGLILRIGVIGVVLSFLAYFSSTYNTNPFLRISLLMIFVLVMAHRSWMFQSPYLYFLSYLAVTIYSYNQQTDSPQSNIQVKLSE